MRSACMHNLIYRQYEIDPKYDYKLDYYIDLTGYKKRLPLVPVDKKYNDLNDEEKQEALEKSGILGYKCNESCPKENINQQNGSAVDRD
jgi:hypothetical protein